MNWYSNAFGGLNVKYENINPFNLIYTHYFYLSFRYHQVATTLVEEIRMHSVGSYKWISIDETRIIRLQNWKDEIHFCPYKPSDGKWILTCKNQLDKVIISNG